jgi:chemotaxis protein MotB
MSSHKKKRNEHHEEAHEGGEPWIVSYADMMTLLFCFFVIMTTFASFDPVVVAKKSAGVAEHFGKAKFDAEIVAMKDLGSEIGTHPNLKGLAQSTVKDGTLEIVFASSLMFPPGEVEIQKEFMKNVDILVGLIKNKNPNYRIIVEGHTDKSPVSSTNKYRSNWELSASRSASIVERFIYYDFKPNQLVSVGFGDSRPVAAEVDKHGQIVPENKALNRRVVIKVLKPLRSTKMKSLGIDTYFDSNEIIKE